MGRSVVSRKDVEQFNKSLSTPGEMERRYRDDQKFRQETERRYEEHLPAPEGPKHLNDEQLQEERNRLSKKLEHEQLAYEQPESGRVYAAPSIEQKSEKPVIDQSPSVPLEADTYTSRLLKYIPAEVIALYLTLDAIIRSRNTNDYLLGYLWCWLSRNLSIFMESCKGKKTGTITPFGYRILCMGVRTWRAFHPFRLV
jgi:hypothetical protein